MQLHDVARNAAIDALTALLNNGTLEFYTGTAPASVATAATGTLLGSLGFSATAFGSASAGSASANTVSDDVSADATGTAGYAVAKDSGGNQRYFFTVGTSGAEINLNTLSFQAGANVSITSGTITMPAS